MKRRLGWVVGLGALVSCVKADIVALHRGEGNARRACMPGVPIGDVGALRGSTTWQADLKAIVDAASACEVVAFETRISPIGAGFITFGGFAADMAQKRRDQLLGTPEPGTSPQALCAAPAGATVATGAVPLPSPDASDFYLMNFPEPAYESVWIPVARRPEQQPAPALGCDQRGAGPPDGGTLCVFTRVALQPDRTRPVVLVGHGLFDSSAHRYVRNTGATLYAMGFSVALVDLRDHGNTLRANGPRDTGLTFGPREGRDLIAIAGALRDSCGAAHAGFVGFSGGAAMGVHAFAVDDGDAFDLGVAAISPLVDPADTIARFNRSEPECPITRALELNGGMHATLTAGMGLLSGAAIGGYELLDSGDLPDGGSLATVSLGTAAATLAISLFVDWRFDGGGQRESACLSIRPIANLFNSLLRERWAALGAAYGLDDSASLAAYPIKRSRISLATLRTVAAALPDQVLRDVPGMRGRLAIVAAADDPVVSQNTVERFARPHPRVAVYLTDHGGHTSFGALNPVYARQFLHHFFCSGPARCVTPP